MSSTQQMLDAAGRRRSPATMPEFHAGRAPGNKGQRYAADPPTVDEIITVMRHARHVGALFGRQAAACLANEDHDGAIGFLDRNGVPQAIGIAGPVSTG